MAGQGLEREFQSFARGAKGLSSLTLKRYADWTANYINPQVVIERQMNVQVMDVFSRLLMDRIRFLGVPIDDDVANIIQAQLLFLESNSSAGGRDINMYINSPGGDAWYLDRLSETLRACQKPILTLYEQMCCSAGYYIGCHGQRIYALTKNDYAGCIGTMCSFYDFEDYFAKLGIKKVEAKATNSDLKNKTFDDLRHGKPKTFVENILDPLNAQFLAEVRGQRKLLAELPDDAPVLRGETFYTPQAVEIGLADGSRTMAQAVAEAMTMGSEYTNANNLKTAIYNI